MAQFNFGFVVFQKRKLALQPSSCFHVVIFEILQYVFIGSECVAVKELLKMQHALIVLPRAATVSMLGAVEHDVTLLAAGHSEMSAWQCGVL